MKNLCEKYECMRLLYALMNLKSDSLSAEVAQSGPEYPFFVAMSTSSADMSTVERYAMK